MQEQRTKRVPKCGYCANHGIKNPLRAHKRDCKFLDCSCKLCENTRLRREHMADMQYIKRNGIVELERLQNDQNFQAKKKDIYVKIFQERMANKNKKRMMKDLKSGSGVPDALLAETGSSAAVSPNSSIGEPTNSLPPQLATLSNLRAFANNSVANNLAVGTTSNSLDSPTNFNSAILRSNRQIFSNTSLFSNSGDNSTASDQFLKAAKLLSFGLNSNTTSSTASSTPVAVAHPLSDHKNTQFFRNNEDIDLNEISEIVDRLSIGNNFNEDEKVLNAAICILFNGPPLASINPATVAEEIYSSN